MKCWIKPNFAMNLCFVKGYKGHVVNTSFLSLTELNEFFNGNHDTP